MIKIKVEKLKYYFLFNIFFFSPSCPLGGMMGSVPPFGGPPSGMPPVGMPPFGGPGGPFPGGMPPWGVPGGLPPPWMNQVMPVYTV